MKCQKCGTEYNSNFCPNCGTQAEQSPAATRITTKCPICGKEYVGNFCPSGCNSPYYKPKKKKSTARVVIGVFIAIVGVIVVAASIANLSDDTSTASSNNSSTVSQSQAAENSSDGKVNYENFEKIETGMTYEQVVEIFGKEGQVLSSVDVGMDEYATTVYCWYDDTGIANCNVTIQGGKVIAKAQAGLK